MGFKINREKSKRHVTTTPWEAYQNQVAARKKAARIPGRVKRIGSKLPRLKQQKHRRLAFRMGMLLTAFGIVFLIALYFVSPLSHIKQINVVGNHALTGHQVAKMSHLKTGDSIYKVIGNEKQLATQVTHHYPRVKQIQFSVHHFNQLKVRLKEYPTAGYVPANGYYRIALVSGVISNERREQPSGQYPVYDKFKSKRQLSMMIRQFAKLTKSVQAGISEIQFSPSKSNSQRIHLYMNDGNEVYASIDTFANKMAYYPSIAAKMSKKGIVNLEVGAYSYSF